MAIIPLFNKVSAAFNLLNVQVSGSNDSVTITTTAPTSNSFTLRKEKIGGYFITNIARVIKSVFSNTKTVVSDKPSGRLELDYRLHIPYRIESLSGTYYGLNAVTQYSIDPAIFNKELAFLLSQQPKTYLQYPGYPLSIAILNPTEKAIIIDIGDVIIVPEITIYPNELSFPSVAPPVDAFISISPDEMNFPSVAPPVDAYIVISSEILNFPHNEVVDPEIVIDPNLLHFPYTEMPNPEIYLSQSVLNFPYTEIPDPEILLNPNLLNFPYTETPNPEISLTPNVLGFPSTEYPDPEIIVYPTSLQFPNTAN